MEYTRKFIAKAEQNHENRFFTMPVHCFDRNYTECLQEDREAIILADKLGYWKPMSANT